MGDYYKVTPDVLIPRDETEIVVKHALDIIKQYGLKSVLEIGSGSGCIACSVAKYGKVDVTSVDISEKALKVASDNASELGVKVKFLQSDLFGALDKNTDKFDIIISNPPYIPAGTELQKEVTFEPEIALFTSESTGCEFYKKIVEQGANYLNHNGYIVFELGVNESEIVRKYFLDNGYTDISVQKDLAGIDRVIRGKCIISSTKF